MQFKKGANQVKRQMWWKDMKLKIIIALVVIVIIAIIIGKIFTYKKEFRLKSK